MCSVGALECERHHPVATLDGERRSMEHLPL